MTPRRAIVLILSASAVAHLLAAIYSVGFYQFDEHFMVYEFAGHLLGRSPASDLPWEFHERLRSFLEPAVVYLVARGASAAGDANPFHWAFLFRLISATLAWASSLALWRASAAWFQTRRAYLLCGGLLFLTWFIPYFHARSSSENWSSSWFVLAFAAALAPLERRDRMPWRAAAIGVCGGLAVLSRYQAIVLVLALAAWLMARKQWRTVAIAAAAFAATQAGGAVLDRWGYGLWTLPFWNYVHTLAIQARGTLSGVEPWWFYFYRAVRDGGFPLSLLLVAGTLAGWVLRPTHPLTIVSASFVIFHVAVPHKELRFIFPALPFCLVLCALVAERLAWPGAKVLGALTAINTAFLIVACIKPSTDVFPLYARLYAAADGGATLLYDGPDPYIIDDLPVNFFRPPALRLVKVGAPESGEFQSMGAHSAAWWFLANGESRPGAIGPPGCEVAARTIPVWLTRFDLNGWLERTRVWTLYRCGATAAPASHPFS